MAPVPSEARVARPALAPPSPDPMLPVLASVVRRTQETADVATLELDGAGFGTHGPGQFAMLTALGVGEAAISMSGDPDAGRVVHTIRAVGAVSAALVRLEPGMRLGVRGPFGVAWPMADAEGRDLLLVASGIGLAPIRPALLAALRRRARVRRLILVYGARTPPEMLYAAAFDGWRRTAGLETRVTLSRAGRDWRGEVGHVTGLLPRLGLDPAATVAFVCGPEPMIRSTAQGLEALGVAGDAIHVSLERSMKCAVGFCGRCQFGPLFLCRDGPVFPWMRVRDPMRVREL
jgi:NAD(P)H-flavin reductase